MLALCWHNVPAYYALNYAGIFDGGLEQSMCYSQLLHVIILHVQLVKGMIVAILYHN